MHRFPTMPLRPGVYSWAVNLFDHEGLVDRWDAVPEFLVTTQPLPTRATNGLDFLIFPPHCPSNRRKDLRGPGFQTTNEGEQTVVGALSSSA